MAKVLSVYLNDDELEMTHSLGSFLGIVEESRVLKVALKHLGNDHIHRELDAEAKKSTTQTLQSSEKKQPFDLTIFRKELGLDKEEEEDIF